ncbi:MAG: DNA polymerase III subunit [Dehalococcoidia bacterium]|nr:DNA polymerase III subunit [Dehalococcoidia bacterium]MDD5493251.1 DNA polymerase III subunit [Dehalococcoidia bacterium]
MWHTIGQDRIIKLFQDSIKRRAMAHAYLLVGPPHVGKMRLALDTAKALNCTGAEQPCDQCSACQRIEQGKHTDVMVIDKYTGRDPKDRKKATEIGISSIRELLQRSASFPPYEGKHKVYIIDDADVMSVEASNCLLKTLEEPPPNVLIILLTAEESLLLPTVVSRCQRMELKPVTLGEIESRLAGMNNLSPERIKLLARLSGGCLGWALLAAGNDAYVKERESRLTEFIPLITSNWDARLSYAQQIASDRSGAEQVIKLWLLWCRDVMLIKYNCEDEITNLDHKDDLKNWANMLTVLEIKDFMDNLNKALVNLTYNANLHLLFEVLMLDMPRKEKRAEYMMHSAGLNQ